MDIGQECVVLGVGGVAEEHGMFFGLIEDPGGNIEAIVKIPSDLGLLRAVHRSRVKLITHF